MKFKASVLRKISTFLQSCPFITIMMDETTNISNCEQAVLIFLLITDDFKENQLPSFSHVHSLPS